MALIKDYYNSRFDVTIPNCYWKIDTENGIEGGKYKIQYRIGCYKTKEIADTNKHDRYYEYHGEFVPDVSETALNFIKQAYLHAKSLQEFADAIDS